MKIIDLFNKIANGEEVPEKIKYRNKIFIYDKDNQCYVVENYNEYDDLHMSLSNHKGTDLNNEVEIIEEEILEEEEKKIPDELNYPHINIESSADDEIRDYLYKVKDKIDEIIDYLDYLKSKGE